MDAQKWSNLPSPEKGGATKKKKEKAATKNGCREKYVDGEPKIPYLFSPTLGENIVGNII